MDGWRCDGILLIIEEATLFSFFIDLLSWSLLLLQLAVLAQVLLQLVIHFVKVVIFKLFLHFSQLCVIAQKFFGVWHLEKLRIWILTQCVLVLILVCVFKLAED